MRTDHISCSLGSLLILSLSVAFTGCVSVQPVRNSTDAILARADSALLASVGPHLHPYFQFDPDSYYEFINRRGRRNWQSFSADEMTRGRFVDGEVRFVLDHPSYDWLKGLRISVGFDSLLHIVEEPQTHTIPPFVLENRPYEFITADSARAIATRNRHQPLLHYGFPFYEAPAPTMRLHYDIQREKRWLWSIFWILSERKDELGNPRGYCEVIKVDALTSEVLERGVFLYSTIY